MLDTIVITGTTNGIGRVTARELALAGYHVIALVRDVSAGAAMHREIVGECSTARLDIVACNLASLDSVRDAAQRVHHSYGAIDMLINNAGIVSMRRRLSADGFELVFATNHLGPFLLTELLRRIMRPRGRIINVASRAHYNATLDLGMVAGPQRARFRPSAAYAQSKLANILYSLALARRLDGAGITVHCLHPGVVSTRLLPPWLRLIKPILSPHILDPERGARSTLYLARETDVSRLHGTYLDEHQRIQMPSPLACSEALQAALWSACAKWTGLA